jgi:hypothetical protein
MRENMVENILVPVLAEIPVYFLCFQTHAVKTSEGIGTIYSNLSLCLYMHVFLNVNRIYKRIEE